MYLNFLTKKKGLKINEIDFNSDLNLTKSIEEIFSRKVDGFLCKNVLNTDTAAILRDYFLDYLRIHESNLDFATTYPRGILECLHLNELPQDYFNGTQKARYEIQHATGIDIVSLFIEKLGRLHTSSPIRVKGYKNDTAFFEGFQFRSIDKDQVGFHPHCEDSLLAWSNKHVNESLGADRVLPGALSFFFTLQNSEGGVITLYDVLWKEGQGRQRLADGRDLVTQSNGDIIDLTSSKVQKKVILTNPGDLFIFRGGDIWHSVNPVHSETARITLGGFLQKGKQEEILLWS